MRQFISRVLESLIDRYDEFRYGWAAKRFRGVNDGVALVVVATVLLGLGVLAAVAMTRPDANGVRLAYSSRTATPSAPVATTEVVTVQRAGTTANARSVKRVVVRTVGGRGTTVRDAITLPGRIVRDTDIVTTRNLVTVTDVQTVTTPPVTVTAPPVTVTVVETVKCKPKDCDHP